MHVRSFRAAVALGAALLLAPVARADVKPNPLIGEGMVLQRDAEVNVWGTADPGEKVTVRFREQEVSAEADKDGKWTVRLKSGAAGESLPMTIAGKNRIALKNVLVGEVWVCSGQSNMQWSISASNQDDKDAVQKAPADSLMRLFTVPRIPKEAPVSEVNASWVGAAPDTVSNFSAVAYFFGRSLREHLKVPVGLLSTNVGGTRAEAWTSRRALVSRPEYRQEVEKFEQALQQFRAAGKTPDAGKAGQKAPAGPLNANSPSALYNGMIAPLLPYTIRGAIWYQGESNAGKPAAYRSLFPLMIRNWREDWKQGEFPFFFVQLAPFMKIKEEPGDSNWAELREAQALTARTVPNTGMAVITDLGHEADIHPTPKQAVGERLARIARATVYGEKVEYSGPEYDGMRVEGNKVVLRFRHLDGGLEARELAPTDARKDKDGNVRGSAWRVKPDSRGAELLGFTVAGEDKKFHTAKARIEGDAVIVWSDQVEKPVAVRYGWADHPVANLFNKEGLPASPFRTDEPATEKQVRR